MSAQLGFSWNGAAPCRFFLGTHEVHWLARTAIPLFVSRRRLMRRRSLPRALGSWALDSGGFTEVSQFGGWTLPARSYAEEVRRYAAEIGKMQWAAIQDWMCEPFVIAKTGKSLAEHQRLTIRSYLDLREIAPEIPWTPVVQGWRLDDYRRHVDDYAAAGVNLAALPIVGVGSICRRQHSTEALHILRTMAQSGIRCHGFGLKVRGLELSARWLASADSMAWSYSARRTPPIDGHPHRSCANCRTYAEAWRSRVLQLPGVS